MPLVRTRFGMSIGMMLWNTILRYANEKRLGRKVTNEDRARIHNGGPNGYKKKATVGYWSDVKGKMK